MKKIWLVAILFVTAIATHGQVTTQKNQSVTLNLLGLHYNYEFPLNHKFTLNTHAGLAGELGYSNVRIGSWYEDDGWMYSLRGMIGADFRYYYNLNKRNLKGKSTDRNSGNFWAVDLSYLTPAFVAENFSASYMILATPYWGIRRVYKSNWLFELNLGLRFGLQGGDWGIGTLTNFKVGYSF